MVHTVGLWDPRVFVRTMCKAASYFRIQDPGHAKGKSIYSSFVLRELQSSDLQG